MWYILFYLYADKNGVNRKHIVLAQLEEKDYNGAQLAEEIKKKKISCCY